MAQESFAYFCLSSYQWIILQVSLQNKHIVPSIFTMLIKALILHFTFRLLTHCLWCLMCGFVIVCLASQEVMKKLEDAANNTKSWKDKVAHHEGLIRLIQPGTDDPLLCPSSSFWKPRWFGTDSVDGESAKTSAMAYWLGLQACNRRVARLIPN